MFMSTCTSPICFDVTQLRCVSYLELTAVSQSLCCVVRPAMEFNYYHHLLDNTQKLRIVSIDLIDVSRADADI